MPNARENIELTLAALAAVGAFSVFAFKLFYEIGKINQRLDLMWEWFIQNHYGPTPNGTVPKQPDSSETRPYA